MRQRVLIIEDEENIRLMIRLTLEAADYDVGEAADGTQGLEVYGEGSDWDVVLLDQRMPGLDGLETLRQIKRRRADARVVIVTAYASIELAVDAMKLGAVDFVRKPMTPEVLRGVVHAALAKPGGQTATESGGPARPGSGAPSESAIPTLTLNGFEIVRSPQTGPRRADNEHWFVVKSPDGQERVVVVEITDDVVGYVERLTRRKLAANNSFWTMRAERLLGNYLWNEGKIPPGRLTLRQIDQAELPVAAGWKEG